MQTGALYIRVSTAEQTELSPSAQKRLLLDYANSNNIHIPENFQFEDEGISGKQESLWKRSSFQKMIQIARQKPAPFTVILVYKFSRFARSQEDSIVYKNLLKKQCGIKVISVTEPLLEGPYGELVERIIEWMDEFYSINLAGEVKKGMTEKALRGGYQSLLPYGYQKGTNELPIPEPESAKVVQLIFQKYAEEKLSERAIAQLLNDYQIKTRRGHPFEARTISYILENPFYIGKIRWNRQSHSTHSIRPESEWILSDAKHEPLIPTPLYEAAQLRKKRGTKPKYRHESSTCKHWLSGLLYCSSCGSPLSYHQSKPYSYFQCNQYTKGQCRHSHFISEKKACAFLLQGITKLHSIAPAFYQKSQVISESRKEQEIRSASLAKLGQKKRRLQSLFLEGLCNPSDFTHLTQQIEEERRQLESHLLPITDTLQNKLETETQTTSLCLLLESTSVTNLVKAEMLRSMISSILYDKENQVFHILLQDSF